MKVSKTVNILFECKVKYNRVFENGSTKKVAEKYLVEAVSFSDAETRFTEYIIPYISGEYQICGIKIAKLNEVFDEKEGDIYFDCKVQFIMLDENSGKEKKTSVKILVKADNIKEAMSNLDEGMKSTIADYSSVLIKETDIMDIYKYE